MTDVEEFLIPLVQELILPPPAWETADPATAAELAFLWGGLSDPQRLALVDPSAEMKQPILVSRALDRRGLDRTPKGAALARWALGNGYARREGSTWLFTEPPGRSRGNRIDLDQLKALAAEGLWASAIAERLGVTREAVRLAATRHSVDLPRKPKRPPREPRTPRPAGPRRTKLVNFNVTEDEYATIKRNATERGMSVAAYVRAQCEATTG